MYIISKLTELNQYISQAKAQGRKINFVPTMGYLHQGHAKLMHEARKQCDILVVSIFVNPLQFGVNEDYSNYPRNLEQDQLICQDNLVDVVFVPSVDELIGSSPLLSQVGVNQLGQHLCGYSRPGHFAGVTTIIVKLLNLVQPRQIYLGRKDIQQLRIIQQLVSDLNFPVEVIGIDTVRDADGLALSSRNSYLSLAERKAALIVPQLINYVSEQLKAHRLSKEQILFQAKQRLDAVRIARLDYLEIVDYQQLQPTTNLCQKIIIATAVYIGKTRLIDNRILELA